MSSPTQLAPTAIFDAVCAGLADCLALVHADVRQMTEHRHRLAQLERHQLLARRIPDPDYWDSNNKEADDDDDPHHLGKLKMLDERLADTFSKALSMNDLQKSSIAAKHLANRNRPSIFQVLLGKTTSKQQQNASSGGGGGGLTLSGQHQATTADGTKKRSSNNLEEQERADTRMVIDDINRQTRLAMQYSKQLEANLLKVEDLRARYEMHLKMSLIASSAGSNSSSVNSKNVKRASSLSSLTWSNTLTSATSSLSRAHRSRSRCGKALPPVAANNNANDHSSSPRATIREFIENINSIEAEFESYMGSLLLTIEDIQGFARVCQGDVFEISIKYGSAQKFKARISVLKENRQKCDNRQAVFKARIADVLAIKAYECKGPLAKRILLGHKLCETRDLFTGRSQLMTISLNQTGSIKLNLIVTWNPLHMTPGSETSLD